MNINLALRRLRAKGVKVLAEGGQLRLDAPGGVLTPAVIDFCCQHKGAILEHLTRDTRRSIWTAKPTLWGYPQIEIPAGTQGWLVDDPEPELVAVRRRAALKGERGAVVWLAGKQRFLAEHEYTAKNGGPVEADGGGQPVITNHVGKGT